MLLCQLVLALALAGVLAESTAHAQQPAPDVPGPQFSIPPQERLHIEADRQEKLGAIYHLRGNVVITYRDIELTADEVDYDEATANVDARGHVHFHRLVEQEDIEANDAHYDLDSELGQFYKVKGRIGAKGAGRHGGAFTTTNPYYFEAERADKVGDNAYMVYDAWVTSCLPSRPLWTFSAARARIEPGESTTIYNGFMKAGNRVPFLFSPFLWHSLKRLPRKSGFLAPTVGNSSRRGRVIGDAFYWAINRSTDAEIGLIYYTERGPSERGSFRTRPSDRTSFTASWYAVQDSGLQLPNGDRIRQGGESVNVNGASDLPHGFRAVANLDYLSSYTFRLAFTETFLEAVNSEVRSSAFITRNFSSYSFDTYAARYQNYQAFPGRFNDEPIDIRTYPSLDFKSYERPLIALHVNGREWPVYLSFSTAAEFLSRSEPALIFSTAGSRVLTGVVPRFDVYPSISAPLHWRGFHLVPTYSVRTTRYGSRLGNGRAVEDAVERNLHELRIELTTPSIERVFTPRWKIFGEQAKHVIQPRAEFHEVDGVRDFNQILRFDERDVLTNTRELEYSVTNSIFSKRADGAVKETFSWELRQFYYFDPTFGGALVPGQRNVFASTLALTGYAFLDEPRRFSPVTSLIRLFPSWNFNAEIRSDWDPEQHRLTNTGFTVNGRHDKLWASVSEFFIHTGSDLQFPSNQLRSQVGYGNPNRRGLNIAASSVYDLRQSLMPYVAIQTNYNFDCCGFSVEWRRFHFGQALRDERQFRVAVTFANIGTFGNLKKQERLF